MDYVKREEPPPQMYSPVSEPLTHNIIYQNQQLPLNIVEQLQLAMQSGISIDSQLQSILIKQPAEHIQILRDREVVDSTNNIQDHKSTTIHNHRVPSAMVQNHRVTPGIITEHRPTPVIVNDHRNSQMVINNHRNSPVIINDHRNSPAIINDHRNSPVIINEHRNSPVIIQDQRNMRNMQECIANNSDIGIDNMRENRVVVDHRVQTDRAHHLQGRGQVHRVNHHGGPTTSNRMMVPPQTEAQLPLPFQIKSEQDPDEQQYFYSHLMQAYAGNGNLQIDHPSVSVTTEDPQQSNSVQYSFSGQVASVVTQTADQYGRQQFFQNYTTDNPGTNAENLVVHRQFEFDSAENLKRERPEPIDKQRHSVQNQNDNVKNKNYYMYEQWSGDKSENDASVQNKLPNTDDVMYKSLIETEYLNIKGEYICARCSGIFPSKRGLKQHAKSCPDNGVAEKTGKFVCAQCSYKCQSPAILKIHERTHTGEKPFSCSFCDYKSGQKNNVAKHILVHMKEKPFRCQYCEYRCAQKNNLVVHERTHTGFKPFACTLCEYKTVQKPNLVKHMYLHTGQKPFSCDVCSYRCVQKTNLTKHKQRHLNEKEGEKTEFKNTNKPYRPRQKTFKCEACPFRCVQKQGLDKHMEFQHGRIVIPDLEGLLPKQDQNADETILGSCSEYIVKSGNLGMDVANDSNVGINKVSERNVGINDANEVNMGINEVNGKINDANEMNMRINEVNETNVPIVGEHNELHESPNLRKDIDDKEIETNRNENIYQDSMMKNQMPSQ